MSDLLADGHHHAVTEHRALLRPLPVEPLDRFAFYDLARSPDLAPAIVTADVRTYANLLLTIGVRAIDAPAEGIL